jgi:hypothetical protein
MSFTSDELKLVNQALGRIGSTSIADNENGLTTCNNWVQSNLHYAQTRDSLLRSYEWNFAMEQAQLDEVSELVLDSQPLPSAWVVDDTITGITSGVTAEILSVTNQTEYEIIYMSGTFSDAETITNAQVYDVLWEGLKLTWESQNVVWYDDTNDQVVCGTGFPSVTSIKPVYRYLHQFELPEDFDRMSRRHKGLQSWAIEGNRVLSMDSTVKITYVKKVTDPNEFDPLFTEVLILSLALKLLTPLAGTQTVNFRQQLIAELRDAMARARTVCSAENNATGNSDWNLSRYGSGKIYPLDPTVIH